MTFESMSHILESISDLLGQAVAGVGLLLGIILGFAIISGAKVRQDRKRARHAVEYVPEYPHVSRLASKEEIEALSARAGIRAAKKEGSHG